MFGRWINDLELVRDAFETAYPFKHVVIDDFFDEETIDRINKATPSTDEFEFTYDNPVEKKSVISDLARVPSIQHVFDELENRIDVFKSLSGIKDLEYDAALHGAGVHRYEQGGKLDLHLDYSMHPVTGKERRLNLIVFTSPWQHDWGGDLELWNSSCTARVKSITPKSNRAVVFGTGDASWHGLPRPIKCPPDASRDSIACYFVSNPTHRMDRSRTKAQFVPHPTQQLPPRVLKLYSVRGVRRIEDADLWDGWKSDPVGRGFWN